MHDNIPTEENGTESEIKLIPTVEGQAKFKASDGKDFIRKQIEPIFELLGWKVLSDKDILLNDIYLDTDTGDLLGQRASCRIRKKSGSAMLTLKLERSRMSGMYIRNEINTSVDIGAVDQILASGGYHPAFDQVRQNLEDLQNKPLIPVVRIQNTRSLLNVRTGDELYEIAIDSFHRVDESGKATSEEFFELEIEAKSIEAEKRLPTIRRQIPGVVKNLTMSEFSKYELASRLPENTVKDKSKTNNIVFAIADKDGKTMQLIKLIASIVAIGSSIAAIATYFRNNQSTPVDQSAKSSKPSLH